MKGRVAFVIGAAAGYVLGTRAGRARYEQIKTGAQAVWGSPPVQRGRAALRGAVDARVERAKRSAADAGKRALSNVFGGSGTAPQRSGERAEGAGS